MPSQPSLPMRAQSYGSWASETDQFVVGNSAQEHPIDMVRLLTARQQHYRVRLQRLCMLLWPFSFTGP